MALAFREGPLLQGQRVRRPRPADALTGLDESGSELPEAAEGRMNEVAPQDATTSGGEQDWESALFPVVQEALHAPRFGKIFGLPPKKPP